MLSDLLNPIKSSCQLFQDLDINDDGFVDVEEFINGLEKLEKMFDLHGYLREEGEKFREAKQEIPFSSFKQAVYRARLLKLIDTLKQGGGKDDAKNPISAKVTVVEYNKHECKGLDSPGEGLTEEELDDFLLREPIDGSKTDCKRWINVEGLDWNAIIKLAVRERRRCVMAQSKLPFCFPRRAIGCTRWRSKMRSKWSSARR